MYLFVKNIAKRYLPKKILIKTIDLYNTFKYLLKSSAFKGNNVYCPCCDKNFLKFDKAIVNKKIVNEKLYPVSLRSVICPYCKSSPRHRIVCDYMKKNRSVLFNNSSKILVFAPAFGIESWFKRNKIKYISADLFDRTADVKVDIQNIQFPDNEFDFISCDHILEHVPDYNLALTELYRVIKGNGKGIVEITVPLLPNMETTYEDEAITNARDRIKAFGQFDHLRIFGMDFENKLRKIGFHVTIYNGDFCEKEISPLSGAASYNYNKLFICRKYDIISK